MKTNIFLNSNYMKKDCMTNEFIDDVLVYLKDNATHIVVKCLGGFIDFEAWSDGCIYGKDFDDTSDDAIETESLIKRINASDSGMLYRKIVIQSWHYTMILTERLSFNGATLKSDIIRISTF